MIVFIPLILAASSATAFAPLPAMKAVIEPPKLCAAVTLLSDAFCKLPSLCSSTASELSNLFETNLSVACGILDGNDRQLVCRKMDIGSEEAI